MKYFRSALVILSFGIFGAGALIINFIIFPFSKILLNKTDYENLSSKIIHYIWGVFINLLSFIRLIKLEINDIQKLTSIKNKVIVATHPSFIDILILISLIPKSTCFVKSKLSKNLILKNILNSIFITNDTDIEQVKKQTKELFDNDFNIIIFPMGTRHHKDEKPKIKKGAALIAMNAKKNIVPIKISTSEDFLFINQPFYQGGNNRVIFDIEILPEIETEKFISDDEIISKKNITKEIEKALYGK